MEGNTRKMWNHRSPWGRSVVVAPKWLSYDWQMGPFGGRTGAKSIDESLWGLRSSTCPSRLLQQRSSSQEAVPFCLLRILHFAGHLGFPGSSVGKESTCNEGDPSWIPELGRSLGEGIGYPLQSSQASPVAQMVKNLPAMRETWIQLLGLEDPLEKGKAIHSSILTWRISLTEQSMGSQRVGHD